MQRVQAQNGVGSGDKNMMELLRMAKLAGMFDLLARASALIDDETLVKHFQEAKESCKSLQANFSKEDEAKWICMVVIGRCVR